jgi:hypothetical protein
MRPRSLLSIALIASSSPAATLGPVPRSAPQLLSETGLYEDVAQKKIAPSNVVYAPQYPLWTDGAIKRRWIYLPPGTKIDNDTIGTNDGWVFPVGTKIWKEFSFSIPGGHKGLRRVETRYMEKIAVNEFAFATYIWSSDETNATLAPAAGLSDVFPTAGGHTHDIPSVDACQACHRKAGDPVLGFDALQLSTDRDLLAPHAEQPIPSAITLEILNQKNLLNSPVTPSPRIVASTPTSRAAIGYLSANCGSCHNPRGIAARIALNFHYPIETATEGSIPAVQTAVNIRARRIVLPGENPTYRIKPGHPESSAVVTTMEQKDLPMPPVGSELIDDDAMILIRKWINYLQ